MHVAIAAPYRKLADNKDSRRAPERFLKLAMKAEENKIQLRSLSDCCTRKAEGIQQQYEDASLPLIPKLYRS